MGEGGTLADGFLYIPDGSPSDGGYRTGWFIHPEPLGVLLNIICWLLLAYGLLLLWYRLRHARQGG